GGKYSSGHRVVLLSGKLLLATDVGHVRDARDLAVLIHADVLVVDRVVVFRQRVDHHLIHYAVTLVIDADALRVDDLNGGFVARLTGDGAEHTIEQRYVAPVAGRIARVADGEFAAAFLKGLVGHDIVGVGRVVPNPESRRTRVSLVISLGLSLALTSGRRLGK